MPTIPNNAPTIAALPVVYRYVEIKQNWGDDWQFIPRLTPLVSEERAAEHVSSADFEYHFGSIKSEEATAFATYLPIDLRNYYIRIMIQYQDQAPVPAWLGIVADEETVIDRATTPSGVQRIKAWGIEHLLDRQTIATANAKNPNGNEVTIARVPPFNERRRGRGGKSLVGNRSNSTGGSGAYAFSRDGKIWTAADVCNYLLAIHAPEPEGMSWALAGEVDALDDITDVWEQDNASVLAVINQIINHRRGLSFYPIEYEGTIYLWVFSVADDAITVGQRTLPANSYPVVFDLPTEHPWAHLVDDIPVGASTVGQYDTIEIQGDLVTVVVTFSVLDGTLVPAWGSALESEYLTAIDPNEDETNDKWRSNERFDGVFTDFKVPPDVWNWMVKTPQGQSQPENALPYPNDDGTFDFQQQGAYWNANREFERNLPLKKGWDYTVSPPQNNGVAGQEVEFVPLIVWIYDNSQGQDRPFEHDFTDRWYAIDRLSEVFADENIRSAGVRPLDGEMGISLAISPRHYFALGSFGSAAATGTDPEFDYNQIVVTAAVKTDVRQRIIVQLNDEPTEVERRLVWRNDAAQFWYICPTSVVAVGSNGLLQRAHRDNLVLRDDVTVLDSMAAFATAWYGKKRQPVSIPIKTVGLFVPLGAMLVEIRAAWEREPIRTPISGRVIDYVRGTTTIETGWRSHDLGLEFDEWQTAVV